MSGHVNKFFGGGLVVGQDFESWGILMYTALGRHQHNHPLVKMEDLVQQVEGKFEQADVNKPPEQEPGIQDIVGGEGEPKKKEADHPVGEVEIQPPKVEMGNAHKEVEAIEEDYVEKVAYNRDQLQFLMGFSLVVGFVFMLLVDQCGGGHSHHIHMQGERSLNLIGSAIH